jgi:phosphoribosylglycinamide formyltransferase-1
MPTDDREEFVSEELKPMAGTADTAAMSRGEAGLPGRFTWRGREYRVAGVIRKWKSSGPCRSGGGERYLRRHWYRVLTEPPAIMTVYYERQARLPKRPKARWWIYTVEAVGAEGGAA